MPWHAAKPRTHYPPPNALQSVAWNSDGLDAYLTEAGQLVRDLDGLLSCIKGTVAQAQGILQQWQRDVMFERREGRVARFEELSSSMRDLVASRHASIIGAVREGDVWLMRQVARMQGLGVKAR